MINFTPKLDYKKSSILGIVRNSKNPELEIGDEGLVPGQNTLPGRCEGLRNQYKELSHISF
ncbi:MAG: hypothetical protein ACI9YL_000250 [Luteibaculaceae bacterium]|jgi:hypothetical protein